MSKSNKEFDAVRKPHSNTGKDQTNEDYKDKTNLQQLFSSLFFGLLTQFDDRYNVNCSNTDETLISQVNTASSDASNVMDIDRMDDNATAGTNAANAHNIDGVLDQIEKLIPHDPITLRQSTLFESTLQLLQWQRDNYLVGDEYADWRKNDRRRQQKQQTNFHATTTVTNYDIPYNGATISHHHISSLASSFIPTEVVQKLLTPIVTGLFMKESGALYDPIKHNTMNLILDQQQLLEKTMKNQIIQLLDNPHNRDAMKDSTQGMIIQTAKIDDANLSNE